MAPPIVRASPMKTLAPLLLAALVAASPVALAKKRVEKATDMPTFTYKVEVVCDGKNITWQVKQ